MCQHGGGQVTNERRDLGMQGSKHRIRLPVAGEVHGIGIDLGSEERRGPTRA